MLTEQQIIEVQQNFPLLNPYLKNFYLSQELRNPSSEVYKAFATLTSDIELRKKFEILQNNAQSQLAESKEKLQNYIVVNKPAVNASQQQKEDYKNNVSLLKNLLAQYDFLQKELQNKIKQFDQASKHRYKLLKNLFSNQEKLLQIIAKVKSNLDLNDAHNYITHLSNLSPEQQKEELLALELNPATAEKANLLLQKNMQLKNELQQQDALMQQLTTDLMQLNDKITGLANQLQQFGQTTKTVYEPQQWMKDAWSKAMQFGQEQKTSEDNETTLNISYRR